MTYEQLRELLYQKGLQRPKLHLFGQSGTGLEAALEYPEGYVFYTVTDLSSSSIVRKGRTGNITLALGVTNTAFSSTISPALPSSPTPNFTNYRVLHAVEEVSGVGQVFAVFNFLTATAISGIVFGMPDVATISGFTELATSPEPDTGHQHTLLDGASGGNASVTITHSAEEIVRVHWALLKA